MGMTEGERWLKKITTGYKMMSEVLAFDGGEIKNIGSQDGVHIWSEDPKKIRAMVEEIGLRVLGEGFTKDLNKFFVVYDGVKVFWLKEKGE